MNLRFLWPSSERRERKRDALRAEQLETRPLCVADHPALAKWDLRFSFTSKKYARALLDRWTKNHIGLRSRPTLFLRFQIPRMRLLLSFEFLLVPNQRLKTDLGFDSARGFSLLGIRWALLRIKGCHHSWKDGTEKKPYFPDGNNDIALPGARLSVSFYSFRNLYVWCRVWILILGLVRFLRERVLLTGKNSKRHAERLIPPFFELWSSLTPLLTTRWLKALMNVVQKWMTDPPISDGSHQTRARPAGRGRQIEPLFDMAEVDTFWCPDFYNHLTHPVGEPSQAITISCWQPESFEGRALWLRSHTGPATIDPDQSYALVEDDDGTNDLV